MQTFLQFLHTAIDRIQPAIQWFRTTVESLLASPDRWIVYVAAGWIALLLIGFPLFRYSGRRRRRSEPFEEVRSYSILGIGPSDHVERADMDDVNRPARTYPRWADAAPLARRPVFRAGLECHANSSIDDRELHSLRHGPLRTPGLLSGLRLRPAHEAERDCLKRLSHSAGLSAVNAEQHGFITGWNSINSTRVPSGS